MKLLPPYTIKVNSSVLWGSIAGIAIFPVIIIAVKGRTPDAIRTIIEHEKIHIWQQLRGLLVVFYLRYAYYNLTVGYDKNPFEIEAYAKQDNWKDEKNNS